MVELKRILLLAAFVAWALCGTAWASTDSVELKLQVKTEFFATSRHDGYAILRSALEDVARTLDMKFDADGGVDEEAVIVRYYDTADGALAEKDFSLREKFKVKDGRPPDVGTLTVKLRRETELGDKELEDFRAGLSPKAEYKYEADVLGLVGGKAGSRSTSYSASAKLKKQPDFAGKTLGSLAELFPLLPFSADAAAVLKPVSSDVRAYEAKIGEVKFNGGEAEMETAVWYDAEGKTLQLVELSWKYKTGKDDERHRALFEALQKRSDLFDAGRLKSSR
ncbi:MAG: hypothetical protein ACOYD9_02005 [Pyramidobacter sp.]|jgi:hypothetical protein